MTRALAELQGLKDITPNLDDKEFRDNHFISYKLEISVVCIHHCVAKCLFNIDTDQNIFLINLILLIKRLSEASHPNVQLHF